MVAFVLILLVRRVRGADASEGRLAVEGLSLLEMVGVGAASVYIVLYRSEIYRTKVEPVEKCPLQLYLLWDSKSHRFPIGF